MANPYIGEIRMFAGTFAPVGWALCEGQTLPISENDVLFQLIGTTYGGDGEQTFNLPDLRGRAPVHMGQGPGISVNYQLGEPFGTESVTLTAQQIPQHDHALLARTAGGNSSTPDGNVLASPPGTTMYIRDTPTVGLDPSILSPVGGSQPHDNRMPYLAVTFIISLFGVFPSQT
jgi:microcystin-dependent protein